MNKIRIYCIILITLITMKPALTFGQSAKEALLSLKKLETRIETGISYRDYAPALGEAKFPVKLFLENEDAKRNPDIATSLSKVLEYYDKALKAWQADLSLTYLGNTVRAYWEDASSELTKASTLLSQAEVVQASMYDEIDKLKKENAALKEDNDSLRKENDQLENKLSSCSQKKKK